MSKFNRQTVRSAAGRGPVTTGTVPAGYTPEGRLGYAREIRGELFLLAVSNLVGQDTFYERARARDSRYVALVHEVALTDPAWLAAFLRWLRTEGNLRSAALVGGLEAAYAMVRSGLHGSRAVVSSVLGRADEPGEALAYWLAKYGRKIPVPVKRGIADAAIDLYTEYALLKYDTASHGVRFGDVIELTHPGDRKASQHLRGDWQGDLFKYALDRRHNRDNPLPESLAMVNRNQWLRESGLDGDWLDPETLRQAGVTWEDVLSLVGNRVDKRKLWEALIPTMGYMALLRNLRNFDQAHVSDAVAEDVAARLADPDEVKKSKQLPFRFYSAFSAVESLRWSHALEKALSASLSNVPALGGRTLVLVDQSPSMWPAYYHMPEHRGIENHDLATLFGSALALRAHDATLVGYGHRSYQVAVPRGGSVLRLMTQFHEESGTDAYGAARDWFTGHDRIVVVTDGENNGRGPRSYEQAGVPASVPVYTWNIGGLKLSQDPGGPNRHTFGGLTDHAFKLIPLLEAGRDGAWPWERGTVA
jgi:hypothetical protein